MSVDFVCVCVSVSEVEIGRGLFVLFEIELWKRIICFVLKLNVFSQMYIEKE